MCKLLRAGFVRIWKMKIFWIGIVAYLVYGFLILPGTYQIAVRHEEIELGAAFAEALFQPFVIVGIVSAVFCGLFVGTEYSDGTIRNKMIVGQSRTAVYMGNFINCAGAAVLQAAVSFAIYWAAGFALMGKPQMGAVQFLWACVILMLLCIAYASIYNFFAMLQGSRTFSSIWNILLAFAFLIVALYFYGKLSQPEMIQEYPIVMDDSGIIGELGVETVPNPNYISGLKRTIYQFLMDFLPGGQLVELADTYERKKMLTHPFLSCVYSGIIIVVSNLAGIVLFWKKDIK